MEKTELAIGTAAGQIYRYLDRKGTASVNQLRKDLPIGRTLLDQAVGWLAREHKLTFTQDKRTLLLSLKKS
jgi:hypothetical protein